jgi:hypothetical protein
MLLPESSSSRLFEYLHFDPPDIVALPLVKNGAEKITQGSSRHSAVADAALSLWLRLDQGQKANVWGLDLLEELVDLGRILDVLCVHYAQYIARDLVLLQKPIAAHRFLVGGVLVFGDTVPIMHLLRPIEAKAYDKALFRQETAPVLIEESTVCLDTIGDALFTGLMLALQRHDLPKIVKAQDHRLTTVPREVDHRPGGSRNVLDDVFLQDGVGHAERLASSIKIFLLQVVAIVTGQVAHGANRLDKNLKFAGGLNHCTILNPWGDYSEG